MTSPTIDLQPNVTLDPDLETRFVNTIRTLAADGVEEAQSGHAGMPMGMAQAAVVLWSNFMQFNPSNPTWFDRDRFVLSAGHGSLLLYSLLHLTGFKEMTLDQIKNFRQWGSKTAGHPEYWHAPGIETTTGPLGQGFANGVGMAIAERWLAEHFNRPDFAVIDHHTYAIVSDGDLMEGVASEAASLAGHLRLGKLIYLYDDNNVTIDGHTEIAYTEDWAKRFEAYGWHVQSIDGMDGDAVHAALVAAHADPRPSLIGCKTIIGYGSPSHAGTSDIHSDAVGDEELARIHESLGFPPDQRFYIPAEVKKLTPQFVEAGNARQVEHNKLLEAYGEKYPDAAAELRQVMSGELAAGWQEALPTFEPGSAMATRNASATVINALAPVLTTLIGGSADLAASNKTNIKDSGDMQADSFKGRNINFGVREHGMASILNGMALHGGVIPFGGTFFVFTDYMRAGMRLSALMGAPVIYVLTHDSIGLGEDGPTHQPVEHLASLRAMPNMTVVRPADANEVSAAWKLALENSDGPTALVLTRQNVTIFDRAGDGLGAASDLARGGYIFYENNADALDIVLIASGSEVEIAYEAAQSLVDEGVSVRVVNLACWELFERQDAAYRTHVLPADTPKIAIEAGSSFGWERWISNDPSKGAVIGVDRFGASAPYQRIYQEYGLTADNVMQHAKKLLKK